MPSHETVTSGSNGRVKSSLRPPPPPEFFPRLEEIQTICLQLTKFHNPSTIDANLMAQPIIIFPLQTMGEPPTHPQFLTHAQDQIQGLCSEIVPVRCNIRFFKCSNWGAPTNYVLENARPFPPFSDWSRILSLTCMS